jgi:hypothetical protein
MRTLIVSDLHLGGRSGADLLRDAELRRPLLRAAEHADRVVLLGDVLEFRHGPPREALAAARPFFSDIGGALARRELIVVAGNHDHALVEPWLSRRGALQAAQPLALEQLLAPGDASPLLEQIAAWAPEARVSAAYPGLWVRPDVYATHGHYLDCHLTVPTLERLSVGVMSRLMGRPAARFSSAADYEAVTAPVYAWRDAVARDAHTGRALNGLATLNAWELLGGGDGVRSPAAGRRAEPRGSLAGRLRTRALVAAFPIAVSALNRAGLGPLSAEISGTELRRAGLRAMTEVARRLGLHGVHVVFGHTHRAGPLARDDVREWRGGAAEPAAAAAGAAGAGVRLMNAGCWTYEPVFLSSSGAESPYWPGGCVVVEESGPPRLERLLLGASPDDLRAARRRSRAPAHG